MANESIDRTAVINLAVLGTSSLDEFGVPTDFNIRDQIHDFSYTLLSDGAGNDSYKFKIELINYNDSVHDSLINAFATSMHHDNRDIIGKRAILEAFPKLAIQWGYPDALSSVHIAQLSDIQYKFTQAKEKILVIEAVNAGNWADEFYKNTNETPLNVAMGIQTESKIKADVKADPSTIFKNTTVSETIISILRGSLATLNGLEVRSFLSEDAMATLNDRYRLLINDLWYGSLSAAEVRDESGDHRGGLVTSDDWASSDIKPLSDQQYVDHHPKLLNSLKYQAIKRFFNIIGFTVINNSVPQSVLETQKYYPLTKTILKEDGSGYGEVTTTIAESQLKGTSNLAQLEPAIEAKAKSALKVNFNAQSYPNIEGEIFEAVRLYNIDNPDNLIDTQDVSITVMLDAVSQNRLKDDAENVLGSVTASQAWTSTGEHINFLPYMRKARPNSFSIIDINKDAIVEGESLTIRSKLISLDYEVQQAKKEAADSKVFTKKQIAENATLGEEKTWEQLDDAERADIMYGNITITLNSAQGKSVLKTVKDVLTRLNIIVSNPKDTLLIHEKSISVPLESLSFEDVVKSFNEDVKSVPTTAFSFSIGKEIRDDANKKLRLINSFPKTQKGLTPKRISVSYGGSDSIVKYFDFTGDIRYLANMQASNATKITLKNTYEYLQTSSRTEIIPVITVLMNSLQFKEALADKYKSNNNFIDRLEVLRDELEGKSRSERRIKSHLNHEFFEQIGFVSEYLSSEENVDNEINNSRTNKSTNQGTSLVVGQSVLDTFTQAEKFFAALTTQVGIASLFTPVQELHAINDPIQKLMAVERGEMEWKPYLKSFVYVMKKNTAFDQYALEAGNARDDLGREMVVTLDTHFRNSREPWKLKVKTLGIPELDTLHEISAPRIFDFEVHDLSREHQTSGYQHWLSGPYRPLAINHKINNSVGYISEFTLMKDMSLN